MKLVIKTKTVEYKVWQASDGTEFEDHDCGEPGPDERVR